MSEAGKMLKCEKHLPMKTILEFLPDLAHLPEGEITVY